MKEKKKKMREVTIEREREMIAIERCKERKKLTDKELEVRVILHIER